MKLFMEQALCVLQTGFQAAPRGLFITTYGYAKWVSVDIDIVKAPAPINYQQTTQYSKTSLRLQGPTTYIRVEVADRDVVWGDVQTGSIGEAVLHGSRIFTCH